MARKPLAKVALLIESGRAFGRGLLSGIAHYAGTHGGWSIIYHPWEWNNKTPAWLMRSHCDGVIARIDSPALLRDLQRLKVPVVDLRRTYRARGVPMVGSEYRLIAKLAVDHLLERGFRRFAYCGFAGVDYSQRRRDDFVSCLHEHDLDVLIYEGGMPRANATSEREVAAMLHERELGNWLAGLPKPIGLMACNDVRGRQVLNACRARRIAVPDEVAVIGVDNDEVLCRLADPPLSSVIPATQRIGYEASALLDKMMANPKFAARDVLIEPQGIATRRSTDVLAVEDASVASALRFIRERASTGINVEDVLDHLCLDDATHVSRSTLEHRFNLTLKRSPKDEILRVRLQRVQELLLATDWSLGVIAQKTGVYGPEYLSTLFKQKTGETPGSYRRRMKQN